MFIGKEDADFNENKKWVTAEKKFRRYSMSAKEKFIRLCLELLTAAVGISPLVLLYTATYLRWRVAHSFRISELYAYLSQSIGPSKLKLNKIAWITAIVMVVLGGAVSALHNTAFTIHKGQLVTNVFAHAKVISANGGLGLIPLINCSSYSIGNLVRKLNTCPFELTPEGYLANSQVANNTGMSEYGGMVFSDQQPVPTITEIMNGTANANATYSNVPLFDYSVNCSVESDSTFNQTIKRALTEINSGNNDDLSIFNVVANDTELPGNSTVYRENSFSYPVVSLSSSRIVGMAKVVSPVNTNITGIPALLYFSNHQSGDLFSHKNVTVTNITTVMPNKGQLEIADFNIPSLHQLTMGTSQLYWSPFLTYLGNNTNGKFSLEFLAMQIKSLLRKGHYLANAGFGSTEPIEGTITTNVNQFNDIKLIRLVLIIQSLIHLISIIIAILSFYTTIIETEIYSASTWWSFGAYAVNKPVDGCTGIMSKEHRNRILALRETMEGHLQMTFPTDGNIPSENLDNMNIRDLRCDLPGTELPDFMAIEKGLI
ncbi:8800_t:CDS:2 [Dentiscutata erythropus]|uniref:8800_t:CDS:1 n=1 Tax=Dentiscutata erythropus TaxID=1348616 RepID=A0A9N9D3M5_9GLOM|nr:8800_t:CDS:2 [Dentiscutata erythropus]